MDRVDVWVIRYSLPEDSTTQAIASAFGIDEERARQYATSAPMVIKHEATPAAARRYVALLEPIGGEVVIVETGQRPEALATKEDVAPPAPTPRRPLGRRASRPARSEAAPGPGGASRPGAGSRGLASFPPPPPPGSMPPPPPPPAAGPPAAAEPGEGGAPDLVDVWVHRFSGETESVIAGLQAAFGIDEGAARHFAESAPGVVKSRINKELSTQFVTALLSIGADVEVVAAGKKPRPRQDWPELTPSGAAGLDGRAPGASAAPKPSKPAPAPPRTSLPPPPPAAAPKGADVPAAPPPAPMMDVWVMAFRAPLAQTVEGLQRHFGLDLQGAHLVATSAPTPLKLNVSRDQVGKFLQVLHSIGADAGAVPAGQRPSSAGVK